MTLLGIAWASLVNRRLTIMLTVLSIAMSVALLLSVEKLRHDARESFVQTVSGVDLVVGARSGAVQLLLYSVFRLGNATNNVDIRSYEDIAARPEVAWTVPFSLGDSHRGYRVLGTDTGYFEHYRTGGRRELRFAEGVPFDDLFDAVLGSEVARALEYRLGDSLVVSHGTGSVGIVEHDDQPFRVAGILAPTGTPVDRTVHVSLQGIEAMHADWRSGAPIPGQSTSPEELRNSTLEPRAITAFLIGLHERRDVFRLQRSINEYTEEPLLAILPGATLQELWNLVGVAGRALLLVSVFVVVVGLVNLVSVLFASLAERRREIAILRACGARARQVFSLLMLEALVVALLGLLVGVLLHAVLVVIGGGVLERRFGLVVELGVPGSQELILLGAILLAALLAGALPAWRAYRHSVADGLTVRL